MGYLKKASVMILAGLLLLFCMPVSADADLGYQETEDAGEKGLPSQHKVYNILVAAKKEYPEGMKWTNDDYYMWNGGVYAAGCGCAAFAFMLSDDAFGALPARIHEDYDNIRVGDILRLYDDRHSVIVLEVRDEKITLAEGNFKGMIHWGRTMTVDEVKADGTYVMTRYPR